MRGWRVVPITGSFKNTSRDATLNYSTNNHKTGNLLIKIISSTRFLIDISDVILDKNKPDFTPQYPDKIKLSINGKEVQLNLTAEQII